jgi:hypothetical protein
MDLPAPLVPDVIIQRWQQLTEKTATLDANRFICLNTCWDCCGTRFHSCAHSDRFNRCRCTSFRKRRDHHYHAGRLHALCLIHV